MEKHVCIHGHFYQPPRENAWLEAIEPQDSAYPYHDWNERIDAECYAPNTAARILDDQRRIAAITNNYARISFNFGPTLLSWLEEKSKEAYQAILAADRESRERFSGHGSAMAQAYNHMIMPLANRRDKVTQVLWGLRDFEHRFKRKPEGMWLPETAVDLESLEILAACGVRFTVLSPYQASRVRPLTDGRAWHDVTGGQIDPTCAYRLRLPSRRTIDLFFYDGPISRAVAFEHILDRGETFAERLMGAFTASRTWPQLVHIATDGETYGHHHRHGEMALAYALKHIEEKGLARLTNYGEYLEKHPPQFEVEIVENTAWSCAHGVERWRSNCGCNSGGRPEWNQEWRLPLRRALDWLRDEVAPLYEQKTSEIFKDPWVARNDYIDIVLERSVEVRERFFREQARRPLSEAEQQVALKLLELQRHAMLMYTSCGWFFDELSGIETVQVIQYAGRVVQLASELGMSKVESEFLTRLHEAKSNVPEHRDGRHIYEKWVKHAMIDLRKVAAHYAMTSLFEPAGEHARIYRYCAASGSSKLLTAGRTRVAIGHVEISSEITLEKATYSYGVLHVGDHNVSGGIRVFRGQAFAGTAQSVEEVFTRGDLTEIIRVLDREFGPRTYSVSMLFKEEQRRVLRAILETNLIETEAVYRHVYQDHAALLRFITSLGMPSPKRLELAAELTLNMDLRREFEAETIDAAQVQALVDEMKAVGVPFDHETLELLVRRRLEHLMARLRRQPESMDRLVELDEALGLAGKLPFEITLWSIQNVYWELAKVILPAVRVKAHHGDESAQAWVERFRSLGDQLAMSAE